VRRLVGDQVSSSISFHPFDDVLSSVNEIFFDVVSIDDVCGIEVVSVSSKSAKDKKKHVLESTTSPSSISTTSKLSSLSSTNSNIKKKFFLNNTDHLANAKYKKLELKLAAYDIDWLDSLATYNECLKYDIEQNLPSSPEEKLLFLLKKFETSDIRLAFADAIGKAAKMVFYPLPPRKEKLMNGFIELISGESSMMDDCSEDSFR
jgi:hypothetical protein